MIFCFSRTSRYFQQPRPTTLCSLRINKAKAGFVSQSVFSSFSHRSFTCHLVHLMNKTINVVYLGTECSCKPPRRGRVFWENLDRSPGFYSGTSSSDECNAQGTAAGGTTGVLTFQRGCFIRCEHFGIVKLF